MNFICCHSGWLALLIELSSPGFVFDNTFVRHTPTPAEMPVQMPRADEDSHDESTFQSTITNHNLWPLIEAALTINSSVRLFGLGNHQNQSISFCSKAFATPDWCLSPNSSGAKEPQGISTVARHGSGKRNLTSIVVDPIRARQWCKAINYIDLTIQHRHQTSPSTFSG